MPKLAKKRKEKIVLDTFAGFRTKVWDCRIGYSSDSELPDDADKLMRKAAAKEFEKLTGHSPDFIFSGWGGELNKIEQDIVEG